MTPLYLDHQATTPLAEGVLGAMLPYFNTHFGNAGSRTHGFGKDARDACEKARFQTASLIGANPRDMIFTSGATESNNIALFGIAQFLAERGKHIITSETEHKSVLDPLAALEARGWSVTRLPVDCDGFIDLEALDDACRADTVLISIMAANNEIGTMADLAAIGRIAKAREVFFHVDAAQSAGLVELNVDACGADLISLSAHKIYGPKGVGALYLRRREPRVRLDPTIFGGGQERGYRSGTLNVPGIVGMGEAARIAETRRPELAKHVRAAARACWDALLESDCQVTLNGPPIDVRLPGNLSLTFEDHIDALELLSDCAEVAAATGSACTSAIPEPSHVLKAIGLKSAASNATVRLGFGQGQGVDEGRAAAAGLIKSLKRLSTSS